MKKYNKLIVSSLLIAFVLSTPAFSFADNNKNDKENKNKIVIKAPPRYIQ